MSLIFINHPLETFTPTSSGALATIIWECCRVAAARGERPTVITRTSKPAQFAWPETISIDYPTIPQNSSLVKLLKAQRKLTGWNHLRHRAYAVRVDQAISRTKDEKAPLVLINDPEMTIFLKGRHPDRRIVHWFENQQESRPRVKRDYAAAASVTCGVSDFTSKWISGYYGVPAVPTLYNGVDTEQFSPARPVTPGLPYLNFVGRTGIEKAPDLLLKAALILTETTRAFGIQLVGSNHWDRFELDDFQRELIGLVEQLKAAGIDVRQTGHVGRALLPEQFRQAHIHVVPSRWDEPFGLTTVEGMASGLATVVSNTGGSPEVVGDAGFLFDRDSSKDLASKLNPLIMDAALLNQYGDRARERAKEFSWSRTWNELRTHAGL